VADTLSEHAKALLARPVIATLTTVAPSGAPQSTPLWVDVHGDDITINTAQGRAKARNMARDPRVSLCVIDPYDPYNVLALSGTVVDMKYLGADSYPARREGEVRIRVRIRPERIAMQPR
jgi:PPOX class probable F420-dependent enzyme